MPTHPARTPTPRVHLSLNAPHLDMRVIDRAAVLLRGVIAEHAAGDVAVAGAAEHGAAGGRSVAVKLAVVHVAGRALRMRACAVKHTPTAKVTAALCCRVLPYLLLPMVQPAACTLARKGSGAAPSHSQ